MCFILKTGNIPPHHPAERHALDLAGSREQRGSAFELYRKPQIGNAGHHHNIRLVELNWRKTLISYLKNRKSFNSFLLNFKFIIIVITFLLLLIRSYI